MNRRHRITFFLPVTYLVIVSIYLIWHGIWFSPDQFFAAALLITLVIGRSKQFLMDWSIPVVLFLSYDYLRGLAPRLSQSAHIYPMINFDRRFFGGLPTNDLQDKLYIAGTIHWYDYIATILYMLHFALPMLVGFIFWLKDRENFKSYFLALLLVSYAAFFTYILFPAMPPWMAGQYGFIPQVSKVMDQVFVNLPQSVDLPSVYKFVGVNLVAAVPSLHAAYPWLSFLFIMRKYKLKCLIVLPYVFGVWFAIVYLGEHYVFDIVAGVLYSSVIFGLVIKGNFIWQKTINSLIYLKSSYISAQKTKESGIIDRN